MASNMMAAQHNCEGLLKFILPDDTMTGNMAAMTLTGIHIYRQNKNCSEKGFIPWSDENTPPAAFLKRVRKTQTKTSKSFLESILDQDLEPNFRPKQPCKCPKLAKLADSQLAKELNSKMITTSNNRGTNNDIILLTVSNMEAQGPK